MTTYQGYANRATWAIALHLTNDQEFMDELHSSEEPPTEAVKDFVESLVADVTDVCPSRPETLLVMDLLNGLLEDVDWSEVAEDVYGE